MKNRFLRLILISVVTLSFTSSAFADVAPPDDPPGSSISPGQATHVQMMAEQVFINVWPFTSPEQNQVRVTADFLLRNRGAQPEHLQVRFPLRDPSGDDNGYGGYPQIHNFAASVANAELLTTVITTSNPLGGDHKPILWAAFEIDFPIEQDVTIQVVYDHEPWDIYPSALIKYLLETGQGWYGPIGNVEVTLRLPYEANKLNVDFTETTAGGKFSENEVHWHWVNLEPRREDNVKIKILYPGLWSALLQAQAEVKAKPDSVREKLALAALYQTIAEDKHGFVRPGDERFAQLSQSAIEEAIALQPQAGALHLKLAEVLFWQSLPIQCQEAQFFQGPIGRRIIEELQLASTLDPTNEELPRTLDLIGVWCEEEFPLFVTRTPTLTLKREVTATQTATATQTPTPIMTITSQPTQMRLTPIPPPETKPTMWSSIAQSGKLIFIIIGILLSILGVGSLAAFWRRRVSR